MTLKCKLAESCSKTDDKCYFKMFKFYNFQTRRHLFGKKNKIIKFISVSIVSSSVEHRPTLDKT